MQVRPIEQADVPSAIALMQRGFPEPAAASWPEFFENVNARQGNELVGPLGYLLRKDENDVGILLTFRSKRDLASSHSVDVVNLSGWYIDEPHRWYAPMMLKRVLSDKAAIFTDLSASEDVLKMLPAFKFRPWTEGVLLTSLPQSFFRYRRDASVLHVDQIPPGAISETDLVLLKDHEALGCRACILEVRGAYYPLVFATRKRRNIPHAYLIFAPDRKIVLSALGNVCAHLLQHGHFLMAIDCNAAECSGIGTFRASNWRKHYAGPANPDGIDYAYSEVVYMGCA